MIKLWSEQIAASGSQVAQKHRISGKGEREWPGSLSPRPSPQPALATDADEKKLFYIGEST